MKNKAFTLIELLGVIVLLGILSIIIIPKVGDSITNSKETALLTQEEQIKKAATDFLIEHTEVLENTNTITIKLGTLKQGGYLPIKLKNPKTRKNLSNESTITITKNGNNYEIKLNLIDLENATENIDSNSPILVLNGNYIEYVEVNETYTELGAKAITSSGEEIDEEDISIQVLYNNEETILRTNELKTYSVVYTVTDEDNRSTSATRTVIVRDSTAPTIIIPKDTNIHVSEIASFNNQSGIVIADNYDANPTLTINSTLANIPGTYVITYTATDSSGNTTTERRVIKVNNNWSDYFTNVEYIESTGTQYIDIGVIPNNTTAYEMKTSVLNENGTDKIIFGSRAGNQRFWLDFDGTGSESRILVGYGYYSYIMKYNLGTVYNISFNTNQNKKIIVNDNEFDILTDYDSTNALPLYLFRTNYGTGYSGNFRIYNFKLYDNNTIIRNYIPVYRNSDKAAGLYDLVQNVFYTNVNTGNFEYNKKIEDDYVRLEYIESEGGQYINTGVIANEKTSIEVDGYTKTSRSLYGSYHSINSTGISDTHTLKFWYNDYDYDTNVQYDERHVFKQDKNLLYIDNNLVHTFDYTIFNSSYPIYLFGRSKNTDGSLNDYGVGRIYNVKIWDNSILIRNMIPCYRKSDGKAGLYDTINNIFYINLGQGEFIKGEL